MGISKFSVSAATDLFSNYSISLKIPNFFNKLILFNTDNFKMNYLGSC